MDEDYKKTQGLSDEKVTQDHVKCQIKRYRQERQTCSPASSLRRERELGAKRRGSFRPLSFRQRGSMGELFVVVCLLLLYEVESLNSTQPTLFQSDSPK